MRDFVVTRVQCGGPPRRLRNLEQPLMVRLPPLYRHQAALLWRLLNPRSRLRRGFLSRAVVSAGAAFSRDDCELVPVRYGPEIYDRDRALADLELAPGSG
jgi:hypothetical protein